MAGSNKARSNMSIFSIDSRNFAKIRKHRLSIWGLRILVVLYGLAILAGFLAPYSYDSEQRDHSYHPPMRIHFVDSRGTFHWRPFVYGSQQGFNEYYESVVMEDPSKAYSLHFFVKGEPYRLLGFIPGRIHLFGVERPGRFYLLGADARGRDLFSRILFGSQISLSVGVVGVAITLAIGLVVGGLSGYFGGRVDFLLMRLCEMVMMVPGFYLMLALRAAFPVQLSSIQVYLLIVVILSFVGWAGLARVIRGMVLSFRKQDFVEAARALGIRDFPIILRHVLPQTLSYIIVTATLSIPSYMLGESGLSLIGLGIQDPQASWGNLLSDAMAISEIRYHPWILIPGLFIFVSVMAFNFLGDGLRDALDPKT